MFLSSSSVFCTCVAHKVIEFELIEFKFQVSPQKQTQTSTFRYLHYFLCTPPPPKSACPLFFASTNNIPKEREGNLPSHPPSHISHPAKSGTEISPPHPNCLPHFVLPGPPGGGAWTTSANSSPPRSSVGLKLFIVLERHFPHATKNTSHPSDSCDVRTSQTPPTPRGIIRQWSRPRIPRVFTFTAEVDKEEKGCYCSVRQHDHHRQQCHPEPFHAQGRSTSRH